MNKDRLSNNRGFTLVELLIATMLIAIVLTGAYTSFEAALRVWKSTSKSDLRPQLDARITFSMLEDDLRGIPTGIGSEFHDGRAMVRGTEDSLELVTIREPFDPKLGESARTMLVSYTVSRTRDGNELVRTETVLESGLAYVHGVTGDVSWDSVDYGKSATLVVASGLSDFNLGYWWYLNRPSTKTPPSWLSPVETDWINGELPEGIRITLEFDHETADGEYAPLAFDSIVAFRQEPSPFPRRLENRKGLV